MIFYAALSHFYEIFTGLGSCIGLTLNKNCRNLLAFIITSKFLDALPLYRQSKQFIRIGIHLSRAALSIWAIRC